MKKILLILTLFATVCYSQIDQRAYYKALESEDVKVLEGKLEELGKLKSSSLIRAYQGAMIAKKSSFLKGMKEKVDTFKEGVDLLESSIEKYPNNTEYRFLRLSVQENCPKILKYYGDLEKDEKFITTHFSELKSQLQQIIKDYARTSEILNVADLK